MPIGKLLQTRLGIEGITPAMPAWQIINNANLMLADDAGLPFR